MTEYDLIICGAGSVGVPSALAASDAGLKVLVLDGRASPGQGENKHAIGGIRATHSQKSKIKICLRSIDIFSTWEEKYGDDIDWISGGYTFVAYTDAHKKMLKEMVEYQKSVGLGIDFVKPDKIMDLVPGISNNGLLGGTWSPGDGSASPLLAINAFYRRSLENGAKYIFKEPVTKINIVENQISEVITSKGHYKTRNFINAAGGNAKEIASLAGIDVPVIPDSHEAGITEPVNRFFSPMVVDIRPAEDVNFGGSKNYYFYQNGHGQIVFCLTPNPPFLGMNKEETSSFLPQIAKRMVTLLPRLKNIKVRRTWRGLYPMTPDGNPIVGKFGPEGYIDAVGLCGQGYMIGPGLGEVLARIVDNKLTNSDKEILKEFSHTRDFGTVEKLK